jgi:hypothetical protein
LWAEAQRSRRCAADDLVDDISPRHTNPFTYWIIKRENAVTPVVFHLPDRGHFPQILRRLHRQAGRFVPLGDQN